MHITSLILQLCSGPLLKQPWQAQKIYNCHRFGVTNQKSHNLWHFQLLWRRFICIDHIKIHENVEITTAERKAKVSWQKISSQWHPRLWFSRRGAITLRLFSHERIVFPAFGSPLESIFMWIFSSASHKNAYRWIHADRGRILYLHQYGKWFIWGDFVRFFIFKEHESQVGNLELCTGGWSHLL